MTSSNEKPRWQPIIELSIVMVTILGSTIPLYCHMDNKTSDQMTMMRQETNAQLSAIHAEMKDFHGRLCAIEERNKGK